MPEIDKHLSLHKPPAHPDFTEVKLSFAPQRQIKPCYKKCLFCLVLVAITITCFNRLEGWKLIAGSYILSSLAFFTIATVLNYFIFMSMKKLISATSQ